LSLEKSLSAKYFEKARIYALISKLPCDHFLDRVPEAEVPVDEPAIPVRHSRGTRWQREKHFGFSGTTHTFFVDRNYLSPRKGHERLQTWKRLVQAQKQSKRRQQMVSN
jgi:hypothetical protein